MKIIYLDQNHWIFLARALKNPHSNEKHTLVLEKLLKAVENGHAILPLSATNIYETSKVNDPSRRESLALVQARLSRGKVLVGRHERLKQELHDALLPLTDIAPTPTDPSWFLSDIFFEAFMEIDDERMPFKAPERIVAAIRNRPAELLFDYWMSPISDKHRNFAVTQWSEGAEDLQQRIELRRQKWKNEPLSMRRRAYSALLLIDELDTVLEIAEGLGIQWRSAAEMGSSAARRVIREVPILYTERELALRLESQNRSIDENDFRDMAAFCAAIPYANIIIGEKQFVNLAKQAQLGQEYDTVLLTKLEEVLDCL